MAKCIFCGKEFEQKNAIHKYCSKKCRDRARFAKDEAEWEAKRNHEAVIQLYDSDYSTREISDITGFSISRIYAIWKKVGLPKRLTKLQLDVKRLREQGKCSVEIAEILGIGIANIPKIARKVGKPFSEDEHQKSVSLTRSNQFKKETEQEKKEYVESFLAEGFSYVSGYSDCDSMVTIRCEKCGSVFERSMVSIRHKNNIKCPGCERIRLQKKAQEKEQERQRLVAERKAKREQKERDRLARIRIVVCEECGKTFTTTRKNQVCCSPECSKKRANRLSSIRKDKRISKDKRIDSDITTKSLYKRDNGICWICGGKCDFDDYEVRNGVIICGDNYPSIDHVVEICNGGEHSWQNVKLAHRRCNSERYWKRDAS